MQKTILVASGTANTGSKVVEQLSATGKVALRALVRNPESDKAKALTEFPNVTVVKGDFEDPASLKAALQGVQRAFLVSGAEDEKQFDREVAFIRAAEEAGLEVTVRVSTTSCLISPDSPAVHARAHDRISKYIEEHKHKVVDMHPNGFMSNLLWQADAAVATGKITYPITPEHAESGPKLAMIDPRDIAGAAVAILLSEGETLASLLAARHLEVHGPRPISIMEQMNAVSAVTGRPLSLNYLPPDEYTQALISMSASPEMAAGASNSALIMFGVKEGPTPMVNETSPELAAIWKPKFSLEDWANDYGAAFAPKA